MKTFVAFLTLPVIFTLVFFATKLYVADQYFAAYSLVLAWFVSFIMWIQNVGQLLQKKDAVVIPAVPRAYISKSKAA
jgi:phosphotransferase system  glucose/maltose/N-acetylglucosamine-specific IIC component